MQNYKLILSVSIMLTLGVFVLVTYMDVPAPNKTQTILLDLNDEKIK